MSSGGGQTPAINTQTKDPWSGAQPYLLNAMSSGSALYNQNIGYQPYTGTTQAPENPWLSGGENMVSPVLWNQTAQGGPSDILAAQNLATQMQGSQGLTPGIQGAIGGLGTVGSQYSDIYNRALGQQNPYLQDIINTNNRQITDKVASQMSGAGRYGSGMYTDVLTRALAESANPILAQDYQARQQQQLAATQGLGTTQQTIADLYGQGLNRAGQWAQVAPALNQAQFMPAQMLQSMGQYETARSQAQLQDQINLYNAQQSYPWEQLARFNAILQGTGGLGGTSVTAATPYQPSLTQRLLGGALAGGGLGSAFGPVGAGVGAVGGGLLGGLL